SGRWSRGGRSASAVPPRTLPARRHEEFRRRFLDRLLASFARTDPDHVLYGAHEDLAVSDSAGARRRLDQAGGLSRRYVIEQQLDLDLRQEVDDVLGAPIELGVAFLAAESLHFRDRHALDPFLGQGFLHFVELEWLDDCFDLFHRRYSSPETLRTVSSRRAPPCPARP